METKNKTKKIFISMLCLLIIGLIGYIIFQHQQINKLSRDMNSETIADNQSAEKPLSAQREDVQKNTMRTPAPVAGGPDEIAELEYQLEAAEEEVDIANKQLSDELAQKAENAKNMIDMQKKMLQDPAYQKTLRSTYKGMLDSIYGSLYKELNLTPEKQDEFQELLLDQMMSSLEINLDTLGTAASEEKRKEIQQHTEDLKKENDGKIGELLGSEDYQKYESYRETLSERQVVEMFTESLSEGNKLTDVQKESLINSMYQERKDLYSQQGWDEERVTFSSEYYGDEGIAKMMDMMERTHDGYINSADATLSASQLEQFKAYLKQQRDMTESALKVSAQMYGGQTAQTDTGKAE